jgi:hypothetical protein
MPSSHHPVVRWRCEQTGTYYCAAADCAPCAARRVRSKRQESCCSPSTWPSRMSTHALPPGISGQALVACMAGCSTLVRHIGRVRSGAVAQRKCSCTCKDRSARGLQWALPCVTIILDLGPGCSENCRWKVREADGWATDTAARKKLSLLEASF